MAENARIKGKIVAFLLVLSLLFTFIPAQAYAVDNFQLNITGISGNLAESKTYSATIQYENNKANSYKDKSSDVQLTCDLYKNSNQIRKAYVTIPIESIASDKSLKSVTVNNLKTVTAPTSLDNATTENLAESVTIRLRYWKTSKGVEQYTCYVEANDESLYNFLQNNSLTIALTFDAKEAATYQATIADTNAAYAEALFKGKSAGDTDIWNIKTKNTPAEQEFDFWSVSPYVVDADTSAWDIHADPLEVSLSAATGDVTFAPNFKLLGITLLDGLRFGEMYEVNEAYRIMPPGKIGDLVAPISKTLITGATALCAIPFSISSLVSDAVELTASIYSGSAVNESNLICSQTYSQNYLTAGQHALFVELPAQNSAITQVTVSVVFKTNAGMRDAVVKTYPLSCIFPATQESSTLQYLETGTTVPMGYFTQAAAVVDSLTGNLTLIAASDRSNESQNSTLYVLSADGASLTLSDASGLTDLVKVKELTAGPDGTIWAYVTSSVEVGNDNGAAGYLAKYQNGAWTLITASKCGEQTSNGYVAADIGHIVAAGTNVIAYDKTWNGSEWITGGHGKTGVAQMDGVYYGCDAQGVYSFDPKNGWTQLLSGSYAYEITDAAAGNLLICRHTESCKDLLLIDVKAKTVASISTELFSSRGIVGNPAGLDRNGIPCFIVVGCNTYNLDQFGHNAIGVLFKYVDGQWVNMKEAAFWADSENPNQYETKTRPAAINTTMNPASGITIYGAEFGSDYHAGSVYIELGNSTITFDPGEGALNNTALGAMTGQILSAVDRTKVPGASRTDYNLAGWFYDAEGTEEWDADTARMPAKDITLYAKWSEAGNEEEQLAWYKRKALTALEKQYKKYSKDDYESDKWIELMTAYTDGVSAINAAEAGSVHIEDNVTAALNAAIAAMQAIPAKDTSTVTVAVSMDANTLGLGYLLEPTLVTVDKGTPVSVVITDLLSQQAKEKYGITTDGNTNKIDAENISTLYPWISDGKPTGSFYLSQVYFPEQTGYSIPDTIQDYITGNGLSFLTEDADGEYLGEFDYLNTSGWTYSVGDKTNGNAEFPSVGASGWGLSDGEVVRWQFTLVGYGADLGADNTAWGTDNIVTVGDKSALTWKVAELRSQFSDATLKAETVYTDALIVLTDAEATEAEIATALKALNDAAFVEPETNVNYTIISGDSSTPIATVTSQVENGTATLHVEADKPCVVIVQKADGTYERLEAVKNGDGHDFVQDDYDDSMEFFVAAKGDYDGNGVFETNDLAIANKDILGTDPIDPIKALIMGTDSGEELEPRNLAILNRAFLDEELTW